MADGFFAKASETGTHYRYRTPALIGPWRTSAGQAVLDAVRASQAYRDPRYRDSLRWLVPGEIEEMTAA